MPTESFADLVTAYLEEHLRGKASYGRMVRVAQHWILRCTTTPTRAQILTRHKEKGHGHFQHGAVQANTELALVRAACRWGLYQERWQGGDPTAGIKKWKRPKRKRIGKLDELRNLLDYFALCATDTEVRDRALFGLQLFTGCRSGEARLARLDAITPYREMGCWQKGRTKTGETQEVPVPWQAMKWIAAWKAIRPRHPSPYLFPGQILGQPLTHDAVRQRWQELRTRLGMLGLWTYDLRRTLACYLGNELHYDDTTIRALLNHFDGSALGHYYFKTFDSLTEPIQAYADWLCALKQDDTAGSRGTTGPQPPLPPVVETRAEWHDYPG